MSINGGYNGHFNRHGDLVRNKAKQEWVVGGKVNVGFLKDLEIQEKRDNGDYLLQSPKGKFYVFKPHMGIYAL